MKIRNRIKPFMVQQTVYKKRETLTLLEDKFDGAGTRQVRFDYHTTTVSPLLCSKTQYLLLYITLLSGLNKAGERGAVVFLRFSCSYYCCTTADGRNVSIIAPSHRSTTSAVRQCSLKFNGIPSVPGILLCRGSAGRWVRLPYDTPTYTAV